MNRFKIHQKFRIKDWQWSSEAHGPIDGYTITSISHPDDKECCNYTLHPFYEDYILGICCWCATYEEIEEMEVF